MLYRQKRHNEVTQERQKIVVQYSQGSVLTVNAKLHPITQQFGAAGLHVYPDVLHNSFSLDKTFRFNQLHLQFC